MQAVSCGVCGGLIEHESRPYRSPEQMSKKRKNGEGDSAISYPMHASLREQIEREGRAPVLGAYYVVARSNPDGTAAANAVQRIVPARGDVRVAFTPQMARVHTSTHCQPDHQLGSSHLLLTYAGFIDAFAFAPQSIVDAGLDRLLERLADDLALYAGREDGFLLIGKRGRPDTLDEFAVVPIELEKSALSVMRVMHFDSNQRSIPVSATDFAGIECDDDINDNNSIHNNNYYNNNDDNSNDDDEYRSSENKSFVMSWPNSDETCPKGFVPLHLLVWVLLQIYIFISRFHHFFFFWCFFF